MNIFELEINDVEFNNLEGLAITSDGSTLYILDGDKQTVLAASLSSNGVGQIDIV